MSSEYNTEKKLDNIPLFDSKYSCLNISKDDWMIVSSMYEKVSRGKFHQLQWITFKNTFFSQNEDFYNEYISNSSIMCLDSYWFRERTFSLKTDGGLRSTSIVSPFIFLTIESFGRSLWNSYRDKIDKKYSKNVFRYYSGDYEQNDASYKNSYKTYCDKVNEESGFKYYVKTDIKNFYDSIQLDLLFDIITQKLDKTNSHDLYTMLLYKELFKYAGFGKFPTIESSVGLSYNLTSLLALYIINIR